MGEGVGDTKVQFDEKKKYLRVSFRTVRSLDFILSIMNVTEDFYINKSHDQVYIFVRLFTHCT